MKQPRRSSRTRSRLPCELELGGRRRRVGGETLSSRRQERLPRTWSRPICETELGKDGRHAWGETMSPRRHDSRPRAGAIWASTSASDVKQPRRSSRTRSRLPCELELGGGSRRAGGDNAQLSTPRRGCRGRGPDRSARLSSQRRTTRLGRNAVLLSPLRHDSRPRAGASDDDFYWHFDQH